MVALMFLQEFTLLSVLVDIVIKEIEQKLMPGSNCSICLKKNRHVTFGVEFDD